MNDTAKSTSLCDASDEALALRAKGGDDEALAILIKRYGSFVHARARSYSRGGPDADDLYQEGMIALLKAVRNYREDAPGRFKTFAAVCVNNKLISTVTAHMLSLIHI